MKKHTTTLRDKEFVEVEREKMRAAKAEQENEAIRALGYALRGDEFLKGEEADWYDDYKRRNPC